MRSRLHALVACAAFLGLLAAKISAQTQNLTFPELLKDRALAVRFLAIARMEGDASSWEEKSVRYTVPGTPVGIKLVGSNLVIVVQVTPFDQVKGGVVLVAQGQIWIRRETGEFSYQTTLETVSLKYGERMLFFPLGRAPDGSAPVRLEIVVERYQEAIPGKKDEKAEPAAGGGKDGSSAPPQSPQLPPASQPSDPAASPSKPEN